MRIRQNISQRTKIVGNKAVDDPDITINHIGGGNTVVPITPRSIHRFMLMQDDYIQLEFSLAEAVHFSIGDNIVDTFFGKYIITTEQMPRYNPQTGGYDYSLRFDSDYMAWKNYLHCLVVNNTRKECRWNLTDKLETQAQQIADNVNIIVSPIVVPNVNPDTGTTTYTSSGYGIAVTADNAAEIKHLAFEGVNIIEAMNMIAEAWGCEWWVTADNITIGNTTYYHTIHFGKCEESGAAYDMQLGNNVESMDVSRDQQTYSTRIYGYGSTKNVPETYDRTLVFTVTNNDTNGFYDADRPLDNDMIVGESTAVVTPIPMNNSATQSGNTYTQSSQHITVTANQRLAGNVSVRMTLVGEWGTLDNIPVVTARLILHVGNTQQVLDESNTINPYEDVSSAIGTAMVWNYGHALDNAISASGLTDVYLEVVWTLQRLVASDIDSALFDGTLSTARAISGETTGTKQVKVIPYGTTDEYAATYKGENGYIQFNGSVPPRWRVGNKYTLKPLSINVPISYYTREYEVDGMGAVGERRIHLDGNRYRDAADASAIVEEAVIWEDEFPRLVLRIKAGSIYKTTKTDTIEHSDGSVSREDWTQYSFQAEYNDGTSWQDFSFETDWIMDGCKLQVAFSSPATAQTSGWMLGGMTFDVGYNNLSKRFTIIRNEEYGAALPNDYIKPSDEDEFTLVGWNPNAMSEMGLISASQTRLEAKVNEYLQALQEGQFAINAKMMSNTMTSYPYCTGTGKDSNGRRMFGMLLAGCKVRVFHGALPGNYKVSRVIGYEYKLDIPFDTPTYIIGETDAYSRLKQLEKQITKIS